MKITKAIYILFMALFLHARLTAQPVGEKQVSEEFPVGKTLTVKVDNYLRSIDIIPTNENKIKVVFVAAIGYLTDDKKYSLKDVGIDIVFAATTMHIESRRNLGSDPRQKSLGPNGQIKVENPGSFNEYVIVDGKVYYRHNPDTISARPLDISPLENAQLKDAIATYKVRIEIYMPANIKLNVINRFGNIRIKGSLDYAELNMLSGKLKTDDIKELKLTSEYSGLTIGRTEKAEITLKTDKLSMGSAGKVIVSSRFSTFDIEDVNYMNILASESDNFNVCSVDSIVGTRSFGKLDIGKLGKTMRMQGNNADIHIGEILEAAELIKIEDTYADINMSLCECKSFKINVKGLASSVFLTDNIRNNVINNTGLKDFKLKPDTEFVTLGKNNLTELSSVLLKEPKAKHTVFDIKCDKCKIDFR